MHIGTVTFYRKSYQFRVEDHRLKTFQFFKNVFFDNLHGIEFGTSDRITRKFFMEDSLLLSYTDSVSNDIIDTMDRIFHLSDDFQYDFSIAFLKYLKLLHEHDSFEQIKDLPVSIETKIDRSLFANAFMNIISDNQSIPKLIWYHGGKHRHQSLSASIIVRGFWREMDKHGVSFSITSKFYRP